ALSSELAGRLPADLGGELLTVGVAGMAGMAFYLLALRVLGVRELSALWEAAGQRLAQISAWLMAIGRAHKSS
ncbi:MAG: hypothetical protein N2439_16820, partial [Anaerolineae bacterium]|nr:hypothetical protein [Anaerolineae bacterium]